MNRTLNKMTNWTSFPSLVLIIVLAIVNSFFVHKFFSLNYASSFLTSYTPLIICAMAQTIVLLGRGIDLSIGSVVSLVNVTVVTLVGMGWSLPLAMLVGVLTGMAVGILNGFVIGILRVTPLLATLATSSIAAGAALWIMPYPGGSVSIDYVLWYQSLIFGFIPAPLIFIVVALLIWFLWRYTPAGLQLYAMGKDIHKTYVSGVPVHRTQFFIYMTSGILSGIAAIALTGNTGAGDPLIGESYTLHAVAASVIGGVSLMGGSGDTYGSIFGSIFLGLAFQLVFVLHFPSYYQDLASGVIVLVGIIGASLMKLRSSRPRIMSTSSR